MSNYPCGNTAGGLVTGLPLQEAIKRGEKNNNKKNQNICFTSAISPFPGYSSGFVSVMLQPGDESLLHWGCANTGCSCVEKQGRWPGATGHGEEHPESTPDSSFCFPSIPGGSCLQRVGTAPLDRGAGNKARSQIRDSVSLLPSGVRGELEHLITISF